MNQAPGQVSASTSRPSISVVIPVHNSAPTLRRCLESLAKSTLLPLECIVVDDGSSDNSAAVARSSGVKLFSTGRQRGPSYARNLGAASAKGDLLLFIDADVAVHPDTLERVGMAFEADPSLDALIGSYDDSPACHDFLSQYRNLMHCYVHQTGRTEASTFWGACGAIRRSLFLEYDGFDEARLQVEDIEFGYRLKRAGRKLALDRNLLVKHLKRWTLIKMLKTDVLGRAIPWTQLILRDRFMPNDLNLRWGQRISVVLSLLLSVLVIFGIFNKMLAFWALSDTILLGSILLILIAIVLFNIDFYAFLASKRGCWFAASAVPLHVGYLFYSGLAFLLGLTAHLIGAPLAREVSS